MKNNLLTFFIYERFVKMLAVVPSKLFLTITTLLAITIFILQLGNPIKVNWEIIRTESMNKKNIVPNVTECPVKPIAKVDEFFEYLSKSLYRCDKPKQFGGVYYGKQIDGDKWVCLDDKYQIIPNKCVVLSFGINNEWSFDDAMDKFGCKVYAFDPTMNVADHFRTPNIQFFKLGISNKEKTINIGKVNSYAGILKMLDLTNNDIDYLKMDVEGSENVFFENLFYDTPELVSRIKQLGMEIHPGRQSENDSQVISNVVQKYFKYFQLLDCFGFELIFYNINAIAGNYYPWKGTNQSRCYEVVWVNTNYEKK